MNLDGAVVIVTGSAGAIGTQIALALAHSGSTVVCTDVDVSRLDATLDAVRPHAPHSLAVAADVTDRGQVDRVVAEAIARFGRVDALVNNAGVFRALGAVHEVDPDVWWGDVTTNLLGPFLFSRAVLPHMIGRNRGVIVNMSGAGFGSAVPGGSGYASAKTALIRLTETMALELGKRASAAGVEGLGRDITVVAIEPGMVDSGITQRMAHDPNGQQWMPFIAANLRAGQTCPPGDVAAAVRQALEAAGDELSGLAWAYDDDVRVLAREANSLREDGAYQLRVRRGFETTVC